jgi:hypothetical protein
MTRIQIFDPAMCCSSGVCGADVDQRLVTAAADIEWARQRGAPVERFNLSQQPMAFADNPVVKSLLERSGPDALPITLVNGEVALAGRYPERAQLARWAGLDATATDKPSGSACCSGGRCC